MTVRLLIGKEPPPRKRRGFKWAEYFFLLIGLAAVDYYIWVQAEAAVYQAYQSWSFDQSLKGRTPSVGGFLSHEIRSMFGERASSEPRTADRVAKPASPWSQRPHQSMVIGRIDIPRLRVSAMVREGVDSGTLRRAVGHIPETPLPGESGNVGLAGHRDTFFRALRNIRRDDGIELETLHGTYRYTVQSAKIAGPKDVSVLAASNGQTLTLVTCYPFYYVGSAPKRFIVRATQVAAMQKRQPPPGS